MQGLRDARWERRWLAPRDWPLKLHIALRQEDGGAAVERRLLEVSNPGHPPFGKHLDVGRVAALSTPGQGSVHAVESWLWQHGLLKDTILSGGIFEVRVNVRDAEELLNTTYLVEGMTFPVGGTSAATLLWAAVVALLSDYEAERGRPPLGFINPWLYSLTSGLKDIDTGTFKAGGGSRLPSTALDSEFTVLTDFCAQAATTPAPATTYLAAISIARSATTSRSAGTPSLVWAVRYSQN